jgi:MYXO-CTERM domain-containing protein
MAGFSLILGNSAFGLITIDDFTAGAASSSEQLGDAGYVDIVDADNLGNAEVTQAGLISGSVVSGQRITSVYASYSPNFLGSPGSMSTTARLVGFGENPGLQVSLQSSFETDQAATSFRNMVVLEYYEDGTDWNSDPASDLSLDFFNSLGVSTAGELQFTVSFAGQSGSLGAGNTFSAFIELWSGGSEPQSARIDQAIDGNVPSTMVWNLGAFALENPDFDFSDVDSISLALEASSDVFRDDLEPVSLDFTITDFSLSAISAVPEPSTYTLALGAIGLGFVALRRRRWNFTST